MLSDSDIIDQVNPFVSNMPGAWSKPYDFAHYKELKEPDFEPGMEDPSCEIALTAGDKQIDWCQPRKPNCPMHRELEPTQRVDPDISYEQRGDVLYGIEDFVAKKSSGLSMIQMIILILIVLLLLIILLSKL
jgi:hypothetical protein